MALLLALALAGVAAAQNWFGGEEEEELEGNSSSWKPEAPETWICYSTARSRRLAALVAV